MRLKMTFDLLSKDCPEEKVLKVLKNFIQNYSQSFDIDQINFDQPCVEYKSHRKYTLEKKETDLGEFLLELIVFKEGQSTGAHIHPPFIADKILQGELEETLFKPSGKKYEKDQIVKRTEGEGRTLFCPDCFPHDVKAVNGNCMSLSLTLGEEKVERISVD